MRINQEEGSKRVRERTLWAEGVLPAAHQRLNQAATAIPADCAALPFADALRELVQVQADTTGFVTRHDFAEILERHFPPDLPDPDRTTE
ncbi:hypothetical protein [Streptomyces sp. NEAU-S7GS2]|uniref:hypothetical protein n=1 Tax=Streptomyces sp. NEAU-S7GS2 TaxID=2202000 RepID=UPI0013A59E85|nr:hypothetical protein [Streptomyces sp. NEAU-S7GS2]